MSIFLLVPVVQLVPGLWTASDEGNAAKCSSIGVLEVCLTFLKSFEACTVHGAKVSGPSM